jgi:hypothetical protein
MSMEHRWNKSDRGKSKYLKKKFTPVSLFLPPVWHRMAWDWTSVESAVNGQRLTAWAYCTVRLWLWRLCGNVGSDLKVCTDETDYGRGRTGSTECYEHFAPKLLVQGCTNPGRRVARATAVCTVAPNVCGSSVWTCCMSLFWRLDFWCSS